MKADRIVVVDDGVIAESARTSSCSQQGGIYAEMYATWVSHSDAAAAA